MTFKSVPFFMALVVLAARPVQAGTTTLDTTKTYQTIEGLGGAITFYDGWVPPILTSWKFTRMLLPD